MPIGLALGLLATLGWGLVDVTATIATRRIGSLRALVGTQVTSLVGLVGLALVACSPGERMGARGDGLLGVRALCRLGSGSV